MPKVMVTDLVTSNPEIFSLSHNTKIQLPSQVGISSMYTRKEIIGHRDSDANFLGRSAWGPGKKHFDLLLIFSVYLFCSACLDFRLLMNKYDG